MSASYPPPALLDKICQRAHLASALAQLPRPWVFTNGVFDVLHRGHVLYLAQARALGSSLIVALNTDASVRRLGKGDDRPLNAQDDRAVVMAGQQAVSLVTWFDYAHPVFDLAAIRAQTDVPLLQGQQHSYFCGAWTGYGFHEDGLKSGLDVAARLRPLLG